MILLEYEAKAMLKKANIAIPHSFIVATSDASPIMPVVLKSQVPTGGRGKLGGIIIVDTKERFADSLKKVKSTPIKGHLPTTVLAEEKLNIDHEYYLSLLINRASASIRLVAHKNGGIEVEANNADGFLNTPITPSTVTDCGQQLARHLDLPHAQIAPLLTNLLQCFTQNDATLIEINPLVLTHDNRLVAGDCKMELDDAAAFRHADWDFEAKPASSNFVLLNPSGNVATIANGAGLAMATVDAVAASSMTPANFLDIGGGATTATIVGAFRQIADLPNVHAIIINIFAGITRCDEVAKAIIAAKQHITDLPPLFIRLNGTNMAVAITLLSSAGIATLDSLEACIQAAEEAINE